MKAAMDLSAKEFCCPLCKGALREEASAYSCIPCMRRYPIVLGIPDFRIFPDPYIGIEADHKKGAYLAERADGLDFLGLVRLYWSITPEVSPDRAEKFIRRTAMLVEKGEECLRTLASSVEPARLSQIERVLEVGCATGGFLVAAKRQYAQVVGADIAFRWLVIARKRLKECGADVPVVCCCAEFLPFPGQSYDLVMAEGVIEHVQSQEKTLHECRRVLAPRGTVFLAAANRFAFAPEPHVHLWGVGFLPRRWMDAYVKRFRGIPYAHIRVPSVWELKRLLRGCGLGGHRILLPSISAEETRRLSPVQRVQVLVFSLMKRMPVLNRLLFVIGPSFNVVAYAEKES